MSKQKTQKLFEAGMKAIAEQPALNVDYFKSQCNGKKPLLDLINLIDDLRQYCSDLSWQLNENYDYEEEE